MLEHAATGWYRLIAPWLACLLALTMVSGASAKEAAPMSNDPELEARVLKIAEELRCLVCQNETIAASHADLAVDLRKQIRLKLAAGESQQQILDFMVTRYGDFVLYRPPLKASTVMLWLGPFVLLVGVALLMAMNIRRRRRSVMAQEWSPEQAQRARDLLGDGEGPP